MKIVQGYWAVSDLVERMHHSLATSSLLVTTELYSCLSSSCLGLSFLQCRTRG